MALTTTQFKEVKHTLRNALMRKMQSYRPESASMPFHTRLLGKDRMALFSFIHSLNTNFGVSIFEPVAMTLAKDKFRKCETQKIAGTTISEHSQILIQNIIDNLTAATAEPNKAKEIKIIRNVCQKGELRTVQLPRVDIFLESHTEELYLFDIKTAKPNKGNFIAFKRTLLEWVAVVLAHNSTAKVHTLIAIPYNPYEPKPYNRWTMKGMLDLESELKVAEGFWDFLGGDGAYQDLLQCFEEVGIELRNDIDEYFARYNR